MNQPEIIMYSTASCPYCVAARNLLQSKNVKWSEISLNAQPEKRTEMMERAGRRTVPQIFVGDTHVGGYDDLDALNQEGALDRLLGVGD
ncbi:MAG: glutaredoxin 3 [Wenzhouxiangella sp.]